MAKLKASQLTMKEHSKAKVELYSRYLSIYLNVLGRATFIEKIYLYDLFAGEGKYTDGGKGSPIATMEVIKNHYENNNQTCPNLEITFNDFGKSEIEPETEKIERVRRFISEMFKPDSVKLNFLNLDYTKAQEQVINKLNVLKASERALLFIDPWGYKEITPKDIKEMLRNGKTEVILFLPIMFMYRFAEKALTDETFSEGKPLKKFLEELFDNTIPQASNATLFVNEIKERFQSYLSMKYVDTFTIEREKNSLFCIFFFTSNKTGYYKMLNAKWDIDEKNGKGFKLLDRHQSSLFDAADCVDYGLIIEQQLKTARGMTNQQLFDLGLEKGFLPAHTNKVLKQYKEERRLEVAALDGKEVRGFYVDDNHERKVLIKLK